MDHFNPNLVVVIVDLKDVLVKMSFRLCSTSGNQKMRILYLFTLLYNFVTSPLMKTNEENVDIFHRKQLKKTASEPR